MRKGRTHLACGLSGRIGLAESGSGSPKGNRSAPQRLFLVGLDPTERPKRVGRFGQVGLMGLMGLVWLAGTPASRAYTNVAVLGLVTNGCVEISGRQYFALTAFNAAGLESEFTAELVYDPLWLVTERSLDGVLWDAVTTNEVAPLRALEFFRLRLEVSR